MTIVLATIAVVPEVQTNHSRVLTEAKADNQKKRKGDCERRVEVIFVCQVEYFTFFSMRVFQFLTYRNI